MRDLPESEWMCSVFRAHFGIVGPDPDGRPGQTRLLLLRKPLNQQTMRVAGMRVD